VAGAIKRRDQIGQQQHRQQDQQQISDNTQSGVSGWRQAAAAEGGSPMQYLNDKSRFFQPF
jgi:hypothetical protein